MRKALEEMQKCPAKHSQDYGGAKTDWYIGLTEDQYYASLLAHEPMVSTPWSSLYSVVYTYFMYAFRAATRPETPTMWCPHQLDHHGAPGQDCYKVQSVS